MKTYYFYTLHGEFAPKDKYDYTALVRESIETKNGLLLRATNNYFDSKRNIREQFQLDNGIDVRYLKYYGFKEITKESYDKIVLDDERIMSRKSEKSKTLLTNYGFDLKGWHKPFKIHFATDSNIDKWLKLRADKISYMDSKNIIIELLDGREI